MLPRANSLLRLFQMSNYAGQMHEFWKRDPASVHQDWDLYFKSAQNLVERKTVVPDERTKELVISAYFLIRYYRMRGHELATLDPLSTPPSIQTSKTLKNSAKSTSRTRSNSTCRTTKYSKKPTWTCLSLSPQRKYSANKSRASSPRSHSGP